MKILQVGSTDLVGARFNGGDLRRMLSGRGHESHHCVWKKDSDDDRTYELVSFRYRWFINDRIFGEIERRLSIQSLLYPFCARLLLDRRFRDADVVHYHLVHARFFSLAAFPLLTRGKPSVWTLHDPWAMTGHCVHPLDCERWRTGCGECPRLDIPIAMERDRTAFMWKAKRALYRRSRLDIVVASPWMLRMAERSPLLSPFRVHLVPHGIDLGVFRPGDGDLAKRRLGVRPGSLVVCFRAAEGEFKGLGHIKDALCRLDAGAPVCLLTFQGTGLVDELRGRYQVIDLGWVDDVGRTVEAYNAADVFLMPSTAEAFGMMAIEAMACGKPVIVFEGTSLPEVVAAPEGGVAVPYGDAEALAAVLARLLGNAEERLAAGRRALAVARERYDARRQVDRLVALYESVAAGAGGRR